MTTNDTEEQTQEKSFSWKTVLFPVIKWGVFALVVIFVGWQIYNSWDEIKNKEFEIRWIPLIGSVLAYAASLYVLAVPFHVILHRLNVPANYLGSANAYLIGHIGKYIPGKAMVVVMRHAFLKRFGITIKQSVLATVIETANTMLGGAFLIAGILLFLRFPASWYESWNSETELISKLQEVSYLPESCKDPYVLFWIISIGCMVLFTLILHPKLIGKFAKTSNDQTSSSEKENDVNAESRQIENTVNKQIDWSMYSITIPTAAFGWLLQGASYWLCLMSVEQIQWNMADPLMIVCCICISIIGGFLLFMPGQIGVRELVLIEALSAITGGKATAVIVALLFRMVTLAVEIPLGLKAWYLERRSK